MQTATKVTPERIAALMANVHYRLATEAGTTSTFYHAYLDDKFYLATGHSACVYPGNFNAEVGEDIALKNAKAAAEAKLWELEGYALYNALMLEGVLSKEASV